MMIRGERLFAPFFVGAIEGPTLLNSLAPAYIRAQ
jgi:hypothetical protein